MATPDCARSRRDRDLDGGTRPHHQQLRRATAWHRLPAIPLVREGPARGRGRPLTHKRQVATRLPRVTVQGPRVTSERPNGGGCDKGWWPLTGWRQHATKGSRVRRACHVAPREVGWRRAQTGGMRQGLVAAHRVPGLVARAGARAGGQGWCQGWWPGLPGLVARAARAGGQGCQGWWPLTGWRQLEETTLECFDWHRARGGWGGVGVTVGPRAQVDEHLPCMVASRYT